jgi:hypothetical protein
MTLAAELVFPLLALAAPPAPSPLALPAGWSEAIASERAFLQTPDDRPEVAIFHLPGEAPLVALQTSGTRFVWEGRILGERDSLALVASTSQGPLTILRSERLGTVQAIPLRREGERLELRILRTLDELPPCLGAQQPEEGDGGVAAALRAGGEGGVAAEPCDDGRRIDVLVRWTPLAQSQAGGAMAIRAIAEASIAVSNHVYRTSGVALELRAVDIGPSEPFDLDLQSGLLTKLRLIDDGHLDLVHAERDALGADLVALLSGSNPGYCGVAYLIGGNSPQLGFSVTVWNCAVGNLTFTHEIGHNQGCCHAPGDGGGCTSGGIYPYSVGYRYTGNSGTQWRSVLAYSPGVRWPRLSSPEVIHDGQPFGTKGPNGADNARTVRETALTLANFRCTVVAESDASVQIDSGLQPIPVNGVPLLIAAVAPPQAHAGGEVEFELVAIADLGASDETLSLRVGSLDLGVILGGVGSDCRIATGRRSISASAFNGQFAADGSLAILITPSLAVDPICQSGEMQLQVRYEPAKAAVPGDLNGDGRVDGSDLGVLLSSWGSCRGCPADLDGDGFVNGADLALLLSSWSE